jgi:Alginate export
MLYGVATCAALATGMATGRADGEEYADSDSSLEFEFEQAAYERALPSPGAAPGYSEVKPPPAKKPPLQPWQGVFYDNDFSYLSDPDHDWLLGEELKDLSADELSLLPEGALVSLGGELRYRYMDESNRLRPGGPARANYQHWRWRQYADLKLDDSLRFYAELIDASMFGNTLSVTGIDVNRWDLQNLFVDVKIAERDEKPVYVRIGRQELLYGSQRLISPLDWANTRRNFEGIKLFSRGETWDLDAFATRTLNTAIPGDGPVARFDNSFDSPNQNHTFSGAWLTYKGVKDQTWDLYWIWDWNRQQLAPRPRFPGGNRHTVGTRWLRNFPVTSEGETPDYIWHADVEGGYQFGDDFGKNVSAGFFTGGLGNTMQSLPWEPSLWVYYDWASGSRNLNSGESNTFHQHYGLVHAYIGQIDNVARQNISDINAKFSVKPVKQVVLETQYHHINLARDSDVLYNITGAPVGQPNSGWHAGDELDLVATYTLNPNFSVQAGYFWFWYGSFIQNNAPRDKAEMFYLQSALRY